MRSRSASIPTLPIADMIAATREIMQRRIPPDRIPKNAAPVNEIVLRGDEIDLTAFPVPKFWPGDGGRYIGTGDITFTRDPGQRPHQCRRATGRCCTAHDASGFTARPASTACSTARHGGRAASPARWWRPTASIRCCSCWARRCSAADESELDVAGGMMGRPVELTEAECVSLPIPAHAEFVIEGVLHPGDSRWKGRSANSPAITGASARRSR